MEVYVIVRYLDNEFRGIESIWQDRERAKEHCERLNEIAELFSYEIIEDCVL